MAAVPVTVRLARMFKAKVTLLHIFRYVPKHRYPIPVEWMVEIIRRDVRTKLVEAKRILHEAGVETEIMVLEDGIPAQQILSFVKVVCRSAACYGNSCGRRYGAIHHRVNSGRGIATSVLPSSDGGATGLPCCAGGYPYAKDSICY